MKRLLVLALPLFAGCATMTGYEPVVDTATHAAINVDRLDSDMEECRMLAEGHYGETILGTLMAGGVGAGAGAFYGSIAAGTGIASGAMIGAPIMMVPTLGYLSYIDNDNYKIAYRTCLRQRGHLVVK